MIEDLMKELRVQAEEYDDELCEAALSEIQELKYQVRTLKLDIQSMNSNTRRMVSAYRQIAELPPERADEAIIIAKIILGDRPNGV
jgi:hypothetical protein